MLPNNDAGLNIAINFRLKVNVDWIIAEELDFYFFTEGNQSGRGSKIRTCNHLSPKQVRYQIALYPENDADWDLNPEAPAKAFLQPFDGHG